MSLEFNSARHDVNQMISSITSSIVKELKEAYPQVVFNSPDKLYESLDDVFSVSKVPFVFIVDEWDRIMREKNEDAQSLKLYLEWLEGIFKDQSYIALAYMTGILPIKKYGNQSALNMFNEFSMTDPDNFAPFIGFTEREVQSLCNEFKMNFNQMQQWYDGYSFTDVPHIYNPNSVVKSISRKRFGSYWTKTETFESLQEYIDMNMEGLRDDIVKLIAGEDVVVNVAKFQNDMVTFKTKNDVLTLLIHLGYLAIKPDSDIRVDNISKFAVHIPNEEIKMEFRNIVEDNEKYSGVYNLISKSYDLLNDIWSLNSDAVAKVFDEAHQDHTSILTYNDENSLSCVISLSLELSTTDTYNVVRELPTGKGYADLVYLPKSGVNKPALLIELKFDKSAQTAINQIKEGDAYSVSAFQNHYRQAQPRAVRCCRGRLPERRTAVQRVRPENKILQQKERACPRRDYAAVPCAARICRQADPLERRGSRGESMELAACPPHRAGAPSGSSERAVSSHAQRILQ